MTKKKILFYTDCFIFGGCEKPIFNLLSSQKHRELYDAKLVYRKSREYEDGMAKAYPKISDLNIIPVRFPDATTIAYFIQGKRQIGFATSYIITLFKVIMKLLAIPILMYEICVLFQIFKRDRSEIVHINNGGYPAALSCQAAAIAAKMVGKNIIIMNVNNIAYPRWSIIEKAIDYLVALSVDRFITGSQASAQALSKNRGFDTRKIKNIYHGIDVPLVEHDDKIYQPSICMVARLEKRKGHKYVIQAFKELLDEQPSMRKIKIYIIGEGPIRYGLRKMVLVNNMQDNIIFMGHRNDYLNYVARSLFLLNPSLGQEDLPLIIIEAMGLGKPAIGTPVAGIPEEIKHGENGILVEPGNVGQLKAAICKLIKDEQIRDQMGVNARKRFDAMFSSEKMVSEYLALYKEV